MSQTVSKESKSKKSFVAKFQQIMPFAQNKTTFDGNEICRERIVELISGMKNINDEFSDLIENDHYFKQRVQEIKDEYNLIITATCWDDKLLKRLTTISTDMKVLTADLVKATKTRADEADKADMQNAVGEVEFNARLNGVMEQMAQNNEQIVGLSEAELVAIRTYTMPANVEDTTNGGSEQLAPFRDMNRQQRGQPCQDYPEEAIAELNRMAEQALKKLPAYSGPQPTYRSDVVKDKENVLRWPGWEEYYQKLTVGAEFVTPCFWSTGKGSGISNGAAESIIWRVNGAENVPTKKDIHAMSPLPFEGGGEVLYMKGVKFTVTESSYDEKKKIYRLTLKEKTQ